MSLSEESESSSEDAELISEELGGVVRGFFLGRTLELAVADLLLDRKH
jgi:hypothetical protein